MIALLLAAAWAAPTLAPLDGFPYPVSAATLDNGLTVWVQPRPDATSVVGYVVVRAGSRYEDEQTSGASHLLEHMLFVQTARWTEPEVRRLIERTGGVYNGYTYPERVGYYARLPAGQTEALIDWLDQVVFQPQLPEEKLGKEREVVFEERGGRDGWTLRAVHRLGLGLSDDDAIRADLWPDSTRRLRVIGEDQSLDSITIDGLRGFYHGHYTPRNATLIVVGPEDPERVLTLAAEHLGGLPAGARRSPPDDTGPSPALGGTVNLTQLWVADQCAVTLGARGPGLASRDVWVATVAMTYLEIGLNDTLRIQRGLTYGVSAVASPQSDSGELRIQADLNCRNVDAATTAFREALAALRRAEINTDWLERARGLSAGRWAISQEDSTQRASWLASRVVLDDPTQNADWRRAIPQVDDAQLAALANTWLTDDATRIWVTRPILTIAQAWIATAALASLVVGLILRRKLRTRRPT